MVPEVETPSLDDLLRCAYTFEVNGRSYLFDGDTMLLTAIPGFARLALERWRRDGSQPDTGTQAILAHIQGRGGFSQLPVVDLEREHESLVEDLLTRSAVVSMTLNLTAWCNLRCSYCYADHGAFHGTSKARYMGIDVVRAAVDRLLSSSSSVVFLSLAGGEPLLHPDIPGLLRMVAEARNASGKRIIVGVTTNGTIWRDAATDSFSDHGVRVGVSIDGTSAVQERQRRSASGASTTETILRNLKRYIARCGVDNVTVAVTCTPANVAGLPTFYEWLRSECDPRIHLSLQPAFVPDGHECSWTDGALDTFRASRRRIFEVEWAVARRSPERTAAEKERDEVLTRRIRISQCAFAAAQCAVSTDGYIYPCSPFVGIEEFRMGNVLLGEPQRPASVERSIRANGIVGREDCRTCWAKYLCSGGCQGVCRVMSGQNRNPTRQGCEVFKAVQEVKLWRAIALAEECRVRVSARVECC